MIFNYNDVSRFCISYHVMNVNVYNIDYIRHVYCRTSLVAFYLTVPLALIFHIAATYTSVSLSSPWVAQQTYTTLTMVDSDMKELMEAMQTNLIAAMAQSEGRTSELIRQSTADLSVELGLLRQEQTRISGEVRSLTET